MTPSSARRSIRPARCCANWATTSWSATIDYRADRGVRPGAAALSSAACTTTSATLPHQERLDSRTRGIARIGRLFSDARIAKIRAAEEDIVGAGAVDLRRRRRGDHPGHRDRTVPDRRVPQARRGVDAGAGRCPGAVQAVFNATGQPAAVVPWGLDRNGLAAVDSVGGQAFDEATLLSLARRDRGGPAVGAPPPVGVLVAVSTLPRRRRRARASHGRHRRSSASSPMNSGSTGCVPVGR